MKNQYFGDIRDLFKFDLSHHLVSTVAGLRQFTFIPMLTPPDARNDGNLITYRPGLPGTHNQALCTYLKSCVQSSNRHVSRVEPYFREQGIRCNIHLPEGYFNYASRRDHFDIIPANWLANALVLFDPDNGMENTRYTHRHLRFGELASIWKRSTGSTVLMVFQFIPRVKRPAYIEQRAREFRLSIGLEPLVITDNQLMFLIVTPDQMRNEVAKALDEYRGRYPRLYVC